VEITAKRSLPTCSYPNCLHVLKISAVVANIATSTLLKISLCILPCTNHFSTPI